MTRNFYTVLAGWFALALVIMFTVAGFVVVSFRESAALDQWVQHTRDVIDTLNEAFAAVIDVESNSRGYAMTGRTEFLEPYAVDKARATQRTKLLLEATRDNREQGGRAKQLSDLVDDKLEFSTEVVALRDNRGAEAARDLVGTERGLKLMRQIRDLVTVMKQEERRLLVERKQASDDARLRAIAFGAAGLVVSILIVFFVFGLVRREGKRRWRAENDLAATNQRLSSSLLQATQLMREKETVDLLADLLHSCQTIDDAREVIGKQVAQALPETRGAVFLFRASRNAVEAVSQWNDPSILTNAMSFGPDECWALKSGRRHLMRSHADVACAHVDPKAVEATVCVPMNIHAETIGVIYVEGKSSQFDDFELDLLMHLSDQIGMALATLRLQQRLRDQSFIDPLTGLFNRRYLEVAIEKEVARLDRNQQPLGLVMIDIDHFKSINDRYGHQAGDTILREISETLRSHTRSQDTLCRYGGEEFLLVMSDASLEATRNRAEELRRAVEKKMVSLGEGRSAAAVTISLGIALYPLHGESWQDAVKRADQALYRAKHEGRNRVVVADASRKSDE